ncbi:hypothetical protein SAMN04490244_107136 [Tranquillimonas rosea]|uniref:Flagellar FliJ protein n=1 Tax=Tranquillimonas rosea TaxID=641238 RepID=A0A1H9VHN4_9RHOB|nr:hypothetical protein [Tranquillimonas rosea]SES21296.1 hypothetical protein SAMN04490244_107136 [Tranquillimonas rosea]
MKKASNDFANVSTAAQVALNGLKNYAYKIEEERDLALFKHDQEWDAARRKFAASQKHYKAFDYGFVQRPSINYEFRKKRNEFAQRRELIERKFDEKRKDVQQVKELLLDRFNDRAKNRDDATRSIAMTFKRSTRQRESGRDR